MKHSIRRKRLLIALIWACLGVLSIGLFLAVKQDPIQAQVIKLLEPPKPTPLPGMAGGMVGAGTIGPPSPTLAAIRRIRSIQPVSPKTIETIRLMGTNAFPALNNIALSRESFWHRFYRQIHPKMPKPIQSRMPLPPTPELLEQRAMEVINAIGVTASRACSEAVIQNLSHPDPHVRRQAAFSLHWTLSNSDEVGDLLESIDWKQLPYELFTTILTYRDRSFPRKSVQTLPRSLSITNLFKYPHLTHFAIQALGDMGEAASGITPVLIEILDHGKLPATKSDPSSAGRFPDEVVLRRNREAAMLSLAKINPQSPEVQQVWIRSLHHPDPSFRVLAAQGLGQATKDVPRIVEQLLGSLQDANLQAWCAKVDAIGALGKAAESALPTLLTFTSESQIQDWFAVMTPSAEKGLPRAHVTHMMLNASVAIGRIDAAMARDHLSIMVEAIGIHSNPVQFLQSAQSLAKEIIPKVEPYLESSSERKQIIAADLLLHLDPQHREAFETLLNHARQDPFHGVHQPLKQLLDHHPSDPEVRSVLNTLMKGERPWDRLRATRLDAQVRKEHEALISILKEGLASSVDKEILFVLTTITTMNLDLSPFLSELEACLKHPSHDIQYVAFKLLSAHAPERLTPLGSF